jgi:hypothetical protein
MLSPKRPELPMTVFKRFPTEDTLACFQADTFPLPVTSRTTTQLLKQLKGDNHLALAPRATISFSTCPNPIRKRLANVFIQSSKKVNKIHPIS